MKALALLSVFLALPLMIPAQTARVIQLSPEDTAKAKQLYQQKAEVEKALVAFTNDIDRRYTQDKKESSGNCIVSAYSGNMTFGECDMNAKPKKVYSWYHKDGWSLGFEFSEDFKFIVPKHQDSNSVTTICPYSETPYCGITLDATQH